MDKSYRRDIMRRAHSMVHSAVKSGELTRLDTCELCEATDTQIVGHHWKGHEHHPLNVLWICQPCNLRLPGEEFHNGSLSPEELKELVCFPDWQPAYNSVRANNLLPIMRSQRMSVYRLHKEINWIRPEGRREISYKTVLTVVNSETIPPATHYGNVLLIARVLGVRLNDIDPISTAATTT